MYFYSDPEVLIREMGNNSVLITPHNYSPEYDNSSISGRYCVQFVCFKNTADGMAVLNWWKDSCIDWCFDRVEDGKFGDQKYLDEFSSRFSGVLTVLKTGNLVTRNTWMNFQVVFPDRKS
ncbi:MAG TPA: hypothetical protein DCD96_06995, partial [Flavobacteriales bacterium]|nr:hypothetical protein [Flavobacteriales bacterium]